MQDRQVRISKFLSLVLRHEPGKIGISLDKNGWAPVSELLRACNARGFRLSREELDRVVAENDKKRFAFNNDLSLIRASQGHSIQVDLGYEPIEPPEILYHGTTERFLSSIREDGLTKRGRTHVHLSEDVASATKVGSRRGAPVVLRIQSGRMHSDGYKFFLSANGIWLTDKVPPDYISFC